MAIPGARTDRAGPTPVRRTERLQGAPPHADLGCMSASPISSGSFRAMAAGAIGGLRATFMRQAFDQAGVLDENLDAGLAALEEQARDLTDAGIAVAKDDLVGHLIDVMG